MSWVDAQAKCCSLGMKLFVVDRPAHLERARTTMQEKVVADNLFYSEENHLNMLNIALDEANLFVFIGKKDRPEKLKFWTAGYEWRKNQHIWCH